MISFSSTLRFKMKKRIIHKSPYFHRSKLIKFRSFRSSFSCETHESLISIRSSIGFTVQNTPKYSIVGYYTSLFTKIVQNHPFSSKSHRQQSTTRDFAYFSTQTYSLNIPKSAIFMTFDRFLESWDTIFHPNRSPSFKNISSILR